MTSLCNIYTILEHEKDQHSDEFFYEKSSRNVAILEILEYMLI